jgi:NAD(P)-dependent dehydrogenase (short-subunit alcohol dehydrogenase family)
MKKVLITGAGSGLGRGTAIGLAKAGHKVFATTHIWAQASDLQREAAKLDLGDQLTVDKLDVLDERDVKRAMSWDFDTFVSNAATGESGPISEIPVDLVRRTFETNVFSNLAMAQQVVRKFIDSQHAGASRCRA